MHEIIRQAEAVFGKAQAFRRYLHAHPELSFREMATQAYIIASLEAENIPCVPIAGTGVLARIEGHGDLRQAIVLRADIDALPVTEETGLDFASQNPGVMHACGHDMHAAVLFGALLLLKEHRKEIHGTVFGLFQPGEERNPGGASLVLAENIFRDYTVRAFIGEHVEPELPTGVFGFRPGKYMASSDEIRFTIRGQGGHGAMRADLKDPVATAAELVTTMLALPGENPDKALPSVISIGRVIANGSTNVIPDSVYLEGTLRAFDEAWREKIKERILEICTEIGQRHGTTVEADIDKGFPSVVNDFRLTDNAAQIAASLFGRDAVRELDMRPTAEDFGFYTQLYPSVFYRLGVGAVEGHSSKLHTSTFCPNENALVYGAAMMAELALELFCCAKQSPPERRSSAAGR